MPELDLLVNYPKTKRDVNQRATQKSEEDRRIGRLFGQDYFDGDRRFGYGGYHYHPRFWQPVIPAFVQQYGLTSSSSVLDVGCAKGFMMHDFSQTVPGIKLKGLDISEYAIGHALEDMRPLICQGNAKELPFADKSFDLIISINTIHNLSPYDCAKALSEIQRVGKNAFITVDAYRTPQEKERMDAWNLTALTYMHVDQWNALFKQAGYTGDYFWFIP